MFITSTPPYTNEPISHSRNDNVEGKTIGATNTRHTIHIGVAATIDVFQNLCVLPKLFEKLLEPLLFISIESDKVPDLEEIISCYAHSSTELKKLLVY